MHSGLVVKALRVPVQGLSPGTGSRGPGHGDGATRAGWTGWSGVARVGSGLEFLLPGDARGREGTGREVGWGRGRVRRRRAKVQRRTFNVQGRMRGSPRQGSGQAPTPPTGGAAVSRCGGVSLPREGIGYAIRRSSPCSCAGTGSSTLRVGRGCGAGAEGRGASEMPSPRWSRGTRMGGVATPRDGIGYAILRFPSRSLGTR